MNRIEITHILCPVDLSEQSKHAFQHAVAIARWYNADVTLAEVLWDAIPPVPFDPPSVSWRGQADEARAELRRFAETDSVGVKVASKLFEGPVVKRILEEARDIPADLIVMGTHGASGFEHLLLGSVTEKVLRKALCPVLTVPPAAADASGVFSPFKRILCAVDLSAASLRGLAHAISLAKESGGRLIVVYVVEWALGTQRGFNLDMSAFRHQLCEEAERNLDEAIPADARNWCDIQTIVEVGSPYEEILNLASQQHCDAIVLGVHARNAASMAFFGSTANHVVRAAKCPVLTVRQ